MYNELKALLTSPDQRYIRAYALTYVTKLKATICNQAGVSMRHEISTRYTAYLSSPCFSILCYTPPHFAQPSMQ